ncbi:MAG: hypothetical protein JXR12_06620 [Neptunomonas phycophila]|uniref:hypothetical protein n=1 Tax=Neptunomonas phycophila TaxID=1572645 RepID=UPI003B8B1044
MPVLFGFLKFQDNTTISLNGRDSEYDLVMNTLTTSNLVDSLTDGDLDEADCNVVVDNNGLMNRAEVNNYFVCQKILQCEAFLDDLEEDEDLFSTISQELSDWKTIREELKHWFIPK